MHSTWVNGIELAYSDTGGERACVIFSHGFFMDSSMFEQQAAALASHFRVICIDARGHGLTSTRGGGPFTYWDLANDLLGLMDTLGIATASLAGLSQGGFTSLRAAMLAPGRVERLILMSTEARGCDNQKRSDYAELFSAWQGSAPPEALLEQLGHQLLGADTPSEEWFAKWRACSWEQLEHPAACLIDRDDIANRLDEISIPALVLWGSSDASLPLCTQTELVAGLAGPVEFKTIAAGSHSLNLSHAKETNQALLDFLGSS